MTLFRQILAWLNGQKSQVAGSVPSRPRLEAEALEDRLLMASNLASGFVVDFGPKGSPVAAGAVGVSTEAYGAALGFGWVDGKGLGATDRGTADPTTRDLVYGSSGTFRIDLLDGTYLVTATLGDPRFDHGLMAISAQGQQVASGLTVRAGHTLEKTFTATVSGGSLLLRFADEGVSDHNFALDSLAITPVVPPIPELQQWRTNMLSFGAKYARQITTPPAPGQSLLGDTYYDAARVFYQIADYTGDYTFRAAAQSAAAIYRDQDVLLNGGRVPGYWDFSYGLALDYQTTGNAADEKAILLLSQHAAYAADTTPLSWTADASHSREVAYTIETLLDAEQVGAPPRARLGELVNQALGHIDQWCVAQTAPYVRPFMVALTAEALIRYQAATGDPRILPAIQTAMDWLWAHTWVPSAQAFRYTDRDTPTGGTNPAPDLNLLIAPAFAWLYHQTGDGKYQIEGDQVFAGGVKYAYLGSAKQFNQNYRWSFDYVGWRSALPLVTPPRA